LLFLAGNSYYEKAWKRCTLALREGFEYEEYHTVIQMIEILETILSSEGFSKTLAAKDRFASAIAEQHLGNTKNALDRFLTVQKQLKPYLSRDREKFLQYVEAGIEIGNQYFLRALPTRALESINSALSMLKYGERLGLSKDEMNQLFAFAHNRLGVSYHLACHSEDAKREFDTSLEYSKACNDVRFAHHTHLDIASIYCFTDVNRRQKHFNRANELLHQHLTRRERRNTKQIGYQLYFDCLADNNIFTRNQLYGNALEALEKGFIYEASSILLFYITSCIMAHEWEDAIEGLKSVLDLTALTEDQRARIYVYHYFSIVEDACGQTDEAMSWNTRLRQILDEDTLFKGTTLDNASDANTTILQNIESEPRPSLSHCGRLYWVRYTGL